MTIFASFERIRIINLPRRADRRREMDAELRRLQLADDSRVDFVDGIVVQDPTPFRTAGEKGVFLAHLGILRDAAAAGESVLILEDDTDFAPDAASWTGVIDCDIAYGGYEASDLGDLQRSDIIGAHCMGFSAQAAIAIAPFLEKLLDHQSPPPIDGAYVWFRRQNPGFTTKFSVPAIASQRASRSDIAARRIFDRVWILRMPVRAARRLKRGAQRGGWTFGLREAIAISVSGVAIASLAAYYFLN